MSVKLSHERLCALHRQHRSITSELTWCRVRPAAVSRARKAMQRTMMRFRTASRRSLRLNVSPFLSARMLRNCPSCPVRRVGGEETHEIRALVGLALGDRFLALVDHAVRVVTAA